MRLLSPVDLWASLGDLDLGVVDDDGISWAHSIEGWHATGGVDAPIVNDPSDHGGVAYPALFSPRALTVDGLAVAPTEDLRYAAEDRLTTAVEALDADTRLVVREPIPKALGVRLVDPGVRWTPVDPFAMAFQISLVAPDPLKYSEPPQTLTAGVAQGAQVRRYQRAYPLTYDTAGDAGDTSTLRPYNRGTIASAATAAVSGPLPSGWSLVIDQLGQRLAFTFAVPAEARVDIDFRAHTALLNGTPQSHYVTTDSVWWRLPRGESSVRLLSPSRADPRAYWTLTYRSAWR